MAGGCRAASVGGGHELARVCSQPALTWVKTTHHLPQLQPVRGAHGAAAQSLRKSDIPWGQEVVWGGFTGGGM